MSNPNDSLLVRPTGRRLRFDAFEVDLDERELRKCGVRVHIQKQPFQILELLLAKRGGLVTRSELAHHLWPGLHVSFGHGLNTAINVLRQVLGDSSSASRYIETRPGLGYRFLVPIEEIPDSAGEEVSSDSNHSIAVLPFDHPAGDPVLAALAGHMTEDLIAGLSSLEQIRVIAHATALRYRPAETDPRAAGHALDVGTVLTGRIEPNGPSLRITAELSDVKSGRRLWGEQYECSDSALFSVEKSISSAVGQRLSLPSALSGGSPLKRRYTAKIDAYQSYRKGKYLQNKLTEADLAKSIAHFESAIALDPSYALAYAGLADTFAVSASLGILPSSDARARAEKLTMRALELDDELAEVHASLAGIRKSFDWDYRAAEKEYRHALELSPGSVEVHRLYAAFLSAMQRTPEALKQLRDARELDPLSPALGVEAARVHYMAREFDECVDQAWQTLVLEPECGSAQHILGLAYEQLGMCDDAITELENARTCSGNDPAILAALGHAHARLGKPEIAGELLRQLDEMSTLRSVSPYWRSLLYTGLEARDLALDALEQGVEGRDVWLVWLKAEPRFDPLRQDRRFLRLLEKVGFDGEALRPVHALAEARQTYR